MAKKAKLDILEIAPDEPAGETPRDEVVLEKAGGDESAAEQTGGDFQSTVIKWMRRPLFWAVFISFSVLGLAVGVWVGLHQSLEGSATAMRGKGAAAVSSPTAAKGGIPCEGMVVDQKDEKGNIRILFCDLVLELENPGKAGAADGDRLDVRRVIHDVLKREAAQEGLSAEGRGRLKEKLKTGLRGLFGENPVKEIYFTRYEMD